MHQAHQVVSLGHLLVCLLLFAVVGREVGFEDLQLVSNALQPTIGSTIVALALLSHDDSLVHKLLCEFELRLVVTLDAAFVEVV